jgi:S1-C subfamily serine protease
LPAVRKLIADLPPDKPVTARVARGAETVDVPITTAEKSDIQGQEVEFPEWGFTATDITPTLARMAQLPSTNGMFISGSQVGGVAGNAGLLQGDVVLKVDATALDNIAQFQQMYKERLASKQELVLLQVKRGALTRFVLVKQTEGGGTPAPDEGDNGGAGNEG